MTKLFFILRLVQYFMELLGWSGLTILFLYLADSLSYGINLVETHNPIQELFNAKFIMYMLYTISVLAFVLAYFKVVLIRKFIRTRNDS